MTVIGWIQILLYCAIVAALVVPLGGSMTRVFNGERTFLAPILRPVETALYRIGGVDETREQHWVIYTVSMLFFHVGGFLILYALMRLQAILPFNPAEQSAVAQDLSFNTAVSFITNTNWQNYGGESTMSYLVQMLGLTHQNFLSAATGIVLAVALIRSFARASMRTIGNFWVDITRCTLYVLLPICVVYGLFLVWQGMPQTLGPYVEATTLEGAKQTIAVGPVASQVAIKMLGTNGGGAVVRRRQRHARFLHRARRHDSAGQHAARRDHRRRRRRRHVRHAPLRHHFDLRRRPDGRAHPRICRQEDRGQGGEDGDARHPDPAADVSRLDRGRYRCSCRGCCDQQSGAARLHRDPVRLHLADRQQRIGLRGAERKHPLLQSHRRRRDAGRPLLDDHPGDGDRGLAGGKEIDSAVGRHLPDHRRAVRRVGGWGDRDHRRPDLLPRARARSHRRTTRDGRRHPVRIELIWD